MAEVNQMQFNKLVQCLYDNGIEADECSTVAEAICYVLDLEINEDMLDMDVYPN